MIEIFDLIYIRITSCKFIDIQIIEKMVFLLIIYAILKYCRVFPLFVLFQIKKATLTNFPCE